MAIINSDDYHDYVIKNGKLIGEFEQMYRNARSIPWHQDEAEKHLDVRLAVEMLRDYSPFDYICDFGCGLGYFLDLLRANLGAQGCASIGYDVSATCCRKGKEIFPDLDFLELDLMSEVPDRIGSQRKKRGKRLFAIRAILWYLFPKINTVVQNISAMISKDDYLLISQTFPPLESDFVGKNVIPNANAILKLFGSDFLCLKTIWLENRISKGNDNWFIGLFQKGR